MGDYRECSILVWSAGSYDLLTSSYTSQPIHDLVFDPFRVNEFVSVGHNGSAVFWMLDETALSVNLNVRRFQGSDYQPSVGGGGKGAIRFPWGEVE